MATPDSRIADILERQETELLADWLAEQEAEGGRLVRMVGQVERREQSRDLLALLRAVVGSGEGRLERLDGVEWQGVRDFLAGISRSRAATGLTPTETAIFILSLKRPLFARLAAAAGGDAGALADDVWSATRLIDALALFTTESYQRSREEIIQRQQSDMLELSTPVVKLWDGVLALPMIGTLDSQRTQVVMETLLQRIVETGAEVAIIDITGVPMVDTLVAQHLIKTVTAARLMGADCIISGIRPQIAQTIVHLGVDLADVTTKASLADAFRLALRRSGLVVRREHLPSGPRDRTAP